MELRLTILCENTAGKSVGVIGEHGFSCFLETERGAFLFDTGQGLAISRNARVLNTDLSSVKAILLSHGHFDHTGGLPEVLRQTGPVDIFAHPDVFRKRYWAGKYEKRFNGMPHSRADLEKLGARFQFREAFCQIVPGMYLSGEIPRQTSFETGDPHLVVVAGEGKSGFVPDPFWDDFSLAIETARGLVVVLGCAHAGLVNILRHFVEKTGHNRIYAVVGGTHLAPAGEKQLDMTIAALRKFGVEKIGVSHCTGLPVAGKLSEQFPGRFLFGTAGTVLEF